MLVACEYDVQSGGLAAPPAPVAWVVETQSPVHFATRSPHNGVGVCVGGGAEVQALKEEKWGKRGGRPVQILDPNRVRKLLGVWRAGGGEGGGGGVRWVGRSAAGVPRGGSVGTPTYIPQNDPHDALIILNIHKWGKNIFRKNLPIGSGSRQPRSDPEVRSGVKKIFCVFQKVLNSLQNSEYFERRHTG